MFFISLYLSLYAFFQVQAPVIVPAVEPAKAVVVPADVPPVEKSVVVKAEPKPFGDHESEELVLPKLPHGKYILTIPETGEATVAPAGVVKLVGPAPPLPPVPPVPNVLSDRAKAIKAAADKATGDAKRDETAQGLAMLYRGISVEAHKSGTAATPETISGTTLLITDTAIARQGVAATTAWAPMRAELRGQMVDAIQTGKTAAQFGDLLDDAASGLEASAPKKSISPEFWTFLLELLKMLLPLLIPK